MIHGTFLSIYVSVIYTILSYINNINNNVCYITLLYMRPALACVQAGNFNFGNFGNF